MLSISREKTIDACEPGGGVLEPDSDRDREGDDDPRERKVSAKLDHIQTGLVPGVRVSKSSKASRWARHRHSGTTNAS